MTLQEQIEEIVQDEQINPTITMGDRIDDTVFLSEGINLDSALISDLNNHEPFTDYDDFVRWVWAKIKNAAYWLWDKLFGE